MRDEKTADKLTGQIVSIFIMLALVICLFVHTKPALAGPYPYPQLTAGSAVLMDARTGQVLFEKNMHQKKYPASITKIVTGMVALEKGNLSDTITMSREAVFSIGRGTSHVALDVDEELTLGQALYALSIASANDAANGIAEYISGDLESFARLMTEEAKEAGALNTSFKNAHGLPDPDHYTTAYDMAKIMIRAMENPVFLQIFGESRYEMPPTNKQPETRFFNSRNALLNGKLPYEGITASKNGWTSLSRHTLVTSARRGNRELIAVVMDNESAQANFEDTVKLLDHGFKEFLEARISIADITTEVLAAGPGQIMKDPDQYLYLERLIHRSLSTDDVKTGYQVLESKDSEFAEVKISLGLKEPSSLMYDNLGDIILTFEAKTAGDSKTPGSNLMRYLLPGSALIFLFLLLVYAGRRIVMKRRRNYRFYRWN